MKIPKNRQHEKTSTTTIKNNNANVNNINGVGFVKIGSLSKHDIDGSENVI